MDYNDFKYNAKRENKSKLSKVVYSYLIKILVVIILCLGSLIYIKQSSKNKKYYKKIVYSSTISFAKIYNAYEKYIGDIIPFKNIFKNNTTIVSKEKFTFKDVKKNNSGYIFYISNNYPIGAIKDGIIIKKEKDSITIQSKDDLTILYKNINNINVDLYDYVESGEILGEASNKIYIEFKKNGKYTSYEKYL